MDEARPAPEELAAPHYATEVRKNNYPMAMLPLSRLPIAQSPTTGGNSR
jgi:hypothetical protein